MTITALLFMVVLLLIVIAVLIIITAIIIIMHYRKTQKQNTYINELINAIRKWKK